MQESREKRHQRRIESDRHESLFQLVDGATQVAGKARDLLASQERSVQAYNAVVGELEAVTGALRSVDPLLLNSYHAIEPVLGAAGICSALLADMKYIQSNRLGVWGWETEAFAAVMEKHKALSEYSTRLGAEAERKKLAATDCGSV